mgnify:FL=1
MKNNQNYSNIFSFRQDFGNIKWAKLVIDLLKKQGIEVTEWAVYASNKVDGQSRHRDEIRAATKVVYNRLAKERADRVSKIESLDCELVE